MITYPSLDKHAAIGVTAPSSGVPESLHPLLKLACQRLEKSGYHLSLSDHVWTQYKAKSAPASIRANELNAMLQDEQIQLIIPPWGGELLIEILEYIDYDQIKNKWILGYSDISVLLLAITLKTGMATAHGTNLSDLRGEFSDETTAMWQEVLSTPAGGECVQYSSAYYQKEWQHEEPSPCVFHLTVPTMWKTISDQQKTNVQGRLLGGCIDVIRHLVGTSYGDVQQFQRTYLHNEPILWYMENCELSTTDLRRSFVQMKLAGWFEHCSGLLIGRSSANQTVDDYTVEDLYRELANELKLPIIYDVDCGHIPPQVTFINGAFAEVIVENGKGIVKQYFRP